MKKKLHKNLLPQLQKRRKGGHTNLKRNQKTLRMHYKDVEKNTKNLKRYQINKEVIKPRMHKETLKRTTNPQQGNIEN